jgi:antitoxin component of RelBE/YafQ-DinJ toxin-antitoxin module
MPDNRKSEYLQIRINDTIKAALKVKAEQMSMNVSEYVRLLILEDARKSFNLPKQEG